MGAFRVKQSCACIALAFVAAGAHAQPGDEEELALAYGDKGMVTIATGTAQPLSRAPSVATVITAEDIAAIGATDLDEVLESVPGLHVSRNSLAYAPIYNIRGINAQFNPQVLVLQNGLPMTTIFLGDRGVIWGGYPVENIARIEVIRGPGSALYGADAFSGVINIITKSAADIDGTRFGARAGSFCTRDGWVLHGGTSGDMKVAAYARVGTTDGSREIVGADAQTPLDALFGTRASRAPGPISTGRDAVDAHLDLGYRQWQFRASLKRRGDVGTGAGTAQALDPGGTNSNTRFTADLTYHSSDLARDWDVTFQGAMFHMKETSFIYLFPPGAFGGAFHDGMIGAPDKWERHARASVSAFYTGFNQHRVRIGAGTERQEIYKIRERKNFNFVYVPGVGNVPLPVGRLVDVSSTNPFLAPRGRTVTFGYIQDEWKLDKDWYLTAGVRHDRYSDFGSTTNPRIAAVWEAAYNFTAKLLAGRAFRAPSFTELYNINNPINIGNPDLRPEKISTVEAAFAWQPAPSAQIGLNVYRYRMRDIIRLIPNADPTTGSTSQNAGSVAGRGLELELQWDISKRMRLNANYAYQRARDVATRSSTGYVPQHHYYARADWRLAQDWRLSGQVNWVQDRQRPAGDPRPPVADYRGADLTLRRVTGAAWDLSVTVRNVFDTRMLEPSLAPGQIPGDLPLPGRSVFVQATYRM